MKIETACTIAAKIETALTIAAKGNAPPIETAIDAIKPKVQK